MLGTFRFGLALLVAASHLYAPVHQRLGASAVIAFYVISGSLMTLVVRETYGPGLRGVRDFFVNRFLRIYPAYWTALFASVLVCLAWPDAVERVSPALRVPPDAASWLRNLALVGLVDEPIRPVPPAWSLAVEVIFYLGIGFGLVRHWSVTALWLAASLGIAVWLLVHGASFGRRYYPPEAASLFFAAGALVYFLRARGGLRWARAAGPLIAAFVALPLVGDRIGLPHTGAGFYLSGVLAVAILGALLDAGPPRAPRLRSADRLLGDLAYPVFLLHYLGGALAGAVLGAGYAPFGAGVFAASLAVTLGFALALHAGIIAPIDRLRALVRADAARGRGGLRPGEAARASRRAMAGAADASEPPV